MVDEHVNVRAGLGSGQSSSWWMDAERMLMKGGGKMLFRLEEDNTCFMVEWEEQNTSAFRLNGWQGYL